MKSFALGLSCVMLADGMDSALGVADFVLSVRQRLERALIARSERGNRYGAVGRTGGVDVDEPNEAALERTPQPRWIGFVIVVVLVLALTVLPTVRRRIKRFMGA